MIIYICYYTNADAEEVFCEAFATKEKAIEYCKMVNKLNCAHDVYDWQEWELSDGHNK